MEIVNDVAEVDGRWCGVGQLSLDRPACVVVDPTRKLPADAQQLLRRPPTKDADLCTDDGFILGSVLSVPAGGYRVEVFNTPDDALGMRLRVHRA